jgi:hypothetical protein
VVAVLVGSLCPQRRANDQMTRMPQDEKRMQQSFPPTDLPGTHQQLVVMVWLTHKRGTTDGRIPEAKVFPQSELWLA